MGRRSVSEEALENLKNVLAAKLVSEKLNAENTSNLKQREILLQRPNSSC